jgi:predicted phage terminase large subunit-like protein
MNDHVNKLLRRAQDQPARKKQEMFGAALSELRIRLERDRQAQPGGLMYFVRYFWDILEPNREFVNGWALEAMALHLEAVSFGRITRLLINVPPGSMKSLLVNVFWPAWEWATINPGLRYISFSYSSLLTERDNQRFLDLMESREFQAMYGHKFNIRGKGVTKVSNDRHGWKFASSVRGTGTGERGDRVLLDDPHNIKEGESQVIREETVRWFREAMSNRLNHMTKSVIIVIMQRVHEDDVSGTILSEGLPYDHLGIPLFYEPGRFGPTSIGWLDPRAEDGENYWPERVPPQAVEEILLMGEFAVAAQYQQRPEPRGGGIFRREWWNIWEPLDGKYPNFDVLIGSCDPAYTQKEGNDPSAFVVLGVNYLPDGSPRVFLVAAWRKYLALHGPEMERELGESPDLFLERQKENWGLVEWIGYTCKRFKVDMLLVEAKASGISVVQELQRLMFSQSFGIEFVNPGRADKTVRANRVQHLFSAGMIYRPDRQWAVMVEDEMAAFNPVKKTSKYDDLTDAVTQGLWWLRERRYLERKEELAAENAIPEGIPTDSIPLYPL